MRNVVVSLRNILLTEAIMRTLDNTGELRCERILPDKVADIPVICQAKQADILLMEATHSTGFSVDDRIRTADCTHTILPGCKVILLCDEIAQPQVARDVMRARQDRRIDGFFYASVTAEYLTAALESL